jgi:hypothetical protein
MTARYRPTCSRLAHAMWAIKQLALFVLPCVILVAAGMLVAKHLAPTEIKLHAPDED